MSCKYPLIALTIVLALLVVVSGVVAGENAQPMTGQMSSDAALVRNRLARPLSMGEPSRISTSGAGDPALTTAGITFAHFFLQDPTISTAWPWWHSHTVVDGSGGVHLAFNDSTNIYYAHCAANCGDAASWHERPLFPVGTYDSMNEPTLGVDANGRPRLMWFTEYSGDTSSHYYYAECNANCTDNTTNWTSVAVVDPGSYGYPHNVRYAALDTQGRPRLVYEMSNYPDYGFYYLTCDAGCTTASNWLTTTVTTPDLRPDELQLVFDQNDRPRVLGYDDNTNALAYAECSSCSTAANWGSVGLFEPIYYLVDYSYVLRVDAQGRPRIAYYAENVNRNVLYYAWSNSSPLTAGGWLSYTLNYPPDSDNGSLDLALDSQGRPRVVFATDKLDLSYLACTANCESTGSTWQQQYVETGAELDASYPIAQIPTCSPPVWMVEGYPSLALDAADNPHVSYFVKHGQLCQDSQGHYQILYNAKGIRFARPGGSSTPTSPASVGLNGPAIGVVGNSYTFTATVSPITATQPITYVWQATGQTAQTHTGRGASDTATFIWPSGAAGVKTITVSASNKAGTAHGNNNILISATPIVFNQWAYLPAVLR